jgi:hypothetical protein
LNKGAEFFSEGLVEDFYDFFLVHLSCSLLKGMEYIALTRKRTFIRLERSAKIIFSYAGDYKPFPRASCISKEALPLPPLPGG